MTEDHRFRFGPETRTGLQGWLGSAPDDRTSNATVTEGAEVRGALP